MERKNFSRKFKRWTALLLVVALFFNGWVNYDFRVQAAEGDLIVTMKSVEAEYTGSAFAPEDLIESITRTDDSSPVELSEVDVSVAKDGAETEILDAGVYTITVTEKSDAENSGSAEFTVSPLDLSEKTLLINGKESGYEADFVYTGEEIKPTVQVKDVSKELYKVDVTGATKAWESVAIEVAPADGNSNVINRVTKEIAISAKPIDGAMVALDNATEIFKSDQTEYMPTVTGLQLLDGTELTAEEMRANRFAREVFDEKGQNVTSIQKPGIYTVKVTAAGNYTGTAETTYKLSYRSDEKATVGLDGNTLTENVFADKVTLEPADGYTLCKGQPTEYTETQTDGVTVLLENAGGEVIKYHTPGFTIDKDVPELEVTTPKGQDNNVWTQSKRIDVKASDTNLYGVYYAADEDVMKNITDGKISDIPKGVTQLVGNSLEIAENINGEKTYYFYAIDKAGHVTKAMATVGNIDNTKPEIGGIGTVDPYWKSAADFPIAFTISDSSGSGVKADSVTAELQGEDGSFSRMDIKLTYSEEDRTLVTGGTITVKQPGVYKLIAQDQAGNETAVSFTVKQDSSAPVLSEISEEAIQGSNKCYDGKIYWFSNQEGITVETTVTNKDQPDGEEISVNKIVYSTDENFENKSEEISGIIKIPTLPDTGTVTYYIKAVDEAGNESAVRSITLAYDGEDPGNPAVILPQENESGWIAAVDQNENETGHIQFNLEITETKSGIKQDTVQYDLGSGYVTPENITVVKAEKGSYKITFTTNEEIPDSVIDTWKIKVADHVGNETTYENTEKIQIDRTAPESDAYIKFINGTEEEQGVSEVVGTEKSRWDQIEDWFQEQWNNLWGRKEITFEVYVRDNLSGFSEDPSEAIEMSYLADGEPKKVKNLQYIDGVSALIDGDTEYALSIYQGSITISEKTSVAISDFKINKLTDCAGNIMDDPITLGDTEGQDIIYLDDVAPKLSISYDKGKFADNKYFYRSRQIVTLTIEERFFEEGKNEGIEPQVTLWRKCTSETIDVSGAEVDAEGFVNITETVIPFEWKKGTNPETPYSYSAAVDLPGEDDKEYEYKFTISYTDASGNAMAGSEGIVVENGTFTSGIFVVDKAAPKLKTFHAVDQSGAGILKDGELYYAKNIEGNDIKLQVSIEDTYFDEKVALEYRTTDGIVNWTSLKPESLEWKHEGKVHTAEYVFDGADDGEHTYEFRVKYADRAGNAMEDATDKELKSADGYYLLDQQIVIDHAAPTLDKLSFSQPVQMYDEETVDAKNGTSTNGTLTEKISDSETKMYYDGTSTVEFKISDGYKKSDDIEIQVFKRANKFERFTAWKAYSGNEISSNGDYAFEIPEEDAEYYFTISYTDRAGNQMVYQESVENTEIGEAYGNGCSEGTYTAPITVIDTQKPECTVTYTKITGEDQYYFNQADDPNGEGFEATVTLKDYNLDTDNTIFTVTAKDINGNDIKCTEINVNGTWDDLKENREKGGYTLEQNKNVYTLKFPLKTEANYDITVNVLDKVEKDNGHKRSFCIDRTTPKITVRAKGGEITNGILPSTDENGNPIDTELTSESDITYEIINDGKFAQIINKLTFGYFAKKEIRVTVTAHDPISGVGTIYYRWENTDSKEDSGYKPLAAAVKDGDESAVTGSFILPISFKGTVRAYAVDLATNSAEKEPSGAPGVISENEKMHEERSDSSIKVLTAYSKTPTYYNGDVKLQFKSTDSYSGIREITYKAGNDINDEKVPYTDVGQEIVTQEIRREHTLSSANNNENNIKLGLKFEDNAGHTRIVPESEIPKINIDTTDPKVTVEYDNNDFLNEKYYKEDRTAIVTVEERNFDPNDVNFDLSGPSPSISGWHHIAGSGCSGGSDPSDTGHTDSCSWRCEVYFGEDGDYTFGFSCVDLAGNEGSYGQIDEFVIDKTMPQIKVEYDNHDVKNEFYYNAPRTATITIDEHNFEASDVEITMTAKDDGAERAIPAVSGWSDEGDIHRATIHFDYDAEFTFDVAYADLAGNEADDYTEDRFVVDLTEPELEIFDIVDMSANNGEVRPGIRYHDTNYDPDGTQIRMIGYHNGVQEMNGTRSLEANGLELKLNDFPYVPESDDMYTMEAVVYDMAGNSSEASVMFSVNRFGSVYTFDEETDALVGDDGRYYTNKEQDLVIYETNVDTLEFKEITCNLNGKLKTLKEGEDYSVDVSGSDVTWKQYAYKIPAKNFAEEGTYILTVYSEDRATNVSDNNTKEKKVEFVVDKTNPSVLVSGVENGEQYLENSRTVTLDVQDNVLLQEVRVTLDGEKTIYSAVQIAEADGQITLTAESANHWQELEVEVADAAGNVEKTEEIRFLITANVFVQFFMNKPLFYGTTVAALAAAGGLWWFIIGKKRKHKEE